MKTVRAYLKICLEIADIDRDKLKGIDNLTDDEYMVLGDIRAEVQNNLGENADLLAKFNLKYEG